MAKRKVITTIAKLQKMFSQLIFLDFKMAKPTKTGDQRRIPTKSKIDKLKKRADNKNQENFFLVKKKSKNNKLKRNKPKSSDSCKTFVWINHK